MKYSPLLLFFPSPLPLHWSARCPTRSPFICASACYHSVVASPLSLLFLSLFASPFLPPFPPHSSPSPLPPSLFPLRSSPFPPFFPILILIHSQSPTLEHYAGLREEDFIDCARDLNTVLKKALATGAKIENSEKTSGLIFAVYKKYSSDRLLSVAKLPAVEI